MALGRDDRYVTDAQGRALAGAQVYYCTQPASTSSIPPSPLATVYSDSAGDPGTNPVITDGFGHSVAYLEDAVLYTVVLVHPLFGPNPVVLPDQTIPSVGTGGGSYQPFNQTPSPATDGTTTVFTLTYTPVAGSLLLTLNGLPQTPGLNYTISGNTITMASAPSSGFPLYAYYWH